MKNITNQQNELLRVIGLAMAMILLLPTPQLHAQVVGNESRWHDQCGGHPAGDLDKDWIVGSWELDDILRGGFYETGKTGAKWSDGDFNGDSVVDSSDLVLMMQSGAYEAGYQCVGVDLEIICDNCRFGRGAFFKLEGNGQSKLIADSDLRPWGLHLHQGTYTLTIWATADKLYHGTSFLPSITFEVDGSSHHLGRIVFEDDKLTADWL